MTDKPPAVTVHGYERPFREWVKDNPI